MSEQLILSEAPRKGNHLFRAILLQTLLTIIGVYDGSIEVMFSLIPLIYAVVPVIPFLIFLYIYIRKKREIVYWDVILIAGIIWGCGFAVTVGFGGIIFMIIAYARKIIDYFV